MAQMSRPAQTAGRSSASALDAVARGADEAVANLRAMVALDTRFPPGAGYDDFADLAEKLVTPLGFGCERVVVPDPLWQVADGPATGRRTNLIATRPSGKPVLGLYFHVDTVPDAPGWQSDPFTLQQDGDRLTGLGAADMKGSIAAVLLALQTAQETGLELAYDPMLLFCTDEEAGLYPGIRYLAEQGRLRGHILNFNGSADARIWAGCFGLFTLRIRLRGRPVHAGEGNRTSAGLNAIEAALPLMAALKDLRPAIAAKVSRLPPPPHASGPLAGQLSIVSAQGGTCAGQVPSQFDITICRRYAPEETYEEARAPIDAVIEAFAGRLPDLGVSVDLIGHLVPTEDPGGPHWPRWQAAMQAGFGYAPADFRRWGAASCSDFGYVQRTGMREILLGGLGRPDRNIHAPGEYTTVTDIVALARSVLAYLAADFMPHLVPEFETRQTEGARHAEP